MRVVAPSVVAPVLEKLPKTLKAAPALTVSVPEVKESEASERRNWVESKASRVSALPASAAAPPPVEEIVTVPAASFRATVTFAPARTSLGDRKPSPAPVIVMFSTSSVFRVAVVASSAWVVNVSAPNPPNKKSFVVITCSFSGVSHSITLFTSTMEREICS